MANKNPRISKSGVTSTGRFPLYSNSPEATDADPSLVRLVRGNSLSTVYLSGGEDLLADDITLEDFSDEDGNLITSDDPEKRVDDGDSENPETRIPSASDISIVSNSVVYDAAGNPSVTLIFKIKNSSGVVLKAMNAKVELV